MKRLDLLTNISVLLASFALIIFLGSSWKQNQHAAQSGAPRTQALIGSTVHINGVNFTQRSKTLVIAISSTCHFCQESEPFYRQLAKQADGKFNLVAVLPSSQQDADKYVHAQISPDIRVVSSSLSSIGVNSTPTLLLIDGQGKVENAWIGKLDAAEQAQMQSRL